MKPSGKHPKLIAKKSSPTELAQGDTIYVPTSVYMVNQSDEKSVCIKTQLIFYTYFLDDVHQLDLFSKQQHQNKDDMESSISSC